MPQNGPVPKQNPVTFWPATETVEDVPRQSVTDLLATLHELEHLGVRFVSLTEALDLTTPAGRAMAGWLAIFAEFEREIPRERTRAGLSQAG